MITFLPPHYTGSEIHIDEEDSLIKENTFKNNPIKKIAIKVSTIIGFTLIIAGFLLRKKI